MSSGWFDANTLTALLPPSTLVPAEELGIQTALGDEEQLSKPWVPHRLKPWAPSVPLQVEPSNVFNIPGSSFFKDEKNLTFSYTKEWLSNLCVYWENL